MKNAQIMEAFNDYTCRFLEVIEKLGLTDYRVWNSLDNLSKATMSKIRRGVCGVSMNTLQEFCQTYNVNANYILTGNGSMFTDGSGEERKTAVIDASQTKAAYEDIIREKNERIEAAEKEMEALRMENYRLTIENNLMREQLGIGEKKPQKSA